MAVAEIDGLAVTRCAHARLESAGKITSKLLAIACLDDVLFAHSADQPLSVVGIDDCQLVDVARTEDLHHDREVDIISHRWMCGIDEVACHDDMLERVLFIDEATQFEQRDRTEVVAVRARNIELGVMTLDDEIENGIEVGRSGHHFGVGYDHVANEQTLQHVRVLGFEDVDTLASEFRRVDRVATQELRDERADHTGRHESGDDVDRLGKLEDDDDRRDGCVGRRRDDSAHRDEGVGTRGSRRTREILLDEITDDTACHRTHEQGRGEDSSGPARPDRHAGRENLCKNERCHQCCRQRARERIRNRRVPDAVDVG